MGTRRIPQDEMVFTVTNLTGEGIVVASARLGPGEVKDIPARHIVGKLDRCQALSELTRLGYIGVQVKFTLMGINSITVDYKYLLSLQSPTAAPYGEVAENSVLEKALSGDILIVCTPATYGTSAAVLNAAVALAFTKTIKVTLETAAGELHTWANFALAAVCTEVVVDVDVAAPTPDSATPLLVDGAVDVVLTYDTDANVTKTYAIADTCTLTMDAVAGGILGYAIASATAVDTVIV